MEDGYNVEVPLLPFEIGLLTYPNATTIQLDSLASLFEFCGSNDTILFSQWCQWNQTEDSLHLSESACWTYFNIASLIFESCSSCLLDDTFQHIRHEASKRRRNEMKSKTFLPMRHFLLFLYLQNIQKTSMKQVDVLDKVGKGSEAMTEVYPALSERCGHCVDFLNENIVEIVTLASLFGKDQILEVEGDEVVFGVNEKACQALDWLVHPVSIKRRRTITSAVQYSTLYILSTLSHLHLETGFIEDKSSFRCDMFSHYLAIWLSNPDHVLHPDLTVLKHPEPSPYIRDPTRGKAPALVAHVHRTAIVIKESDHSIDSTLRIMFCTNAQIFILAPFKNIIIEESHHCHIVVAAVSHIFSLKNSRRLSVSVACMQATCSGIEGTSLSICTNTRPILLERCSHLTLAPFACSIPDHESVLQKVHLNPQVNLFNHVIPVIPKGPHATEYDLLPPSSFCPTLLPLTLSTIQPNPCHIPDEYRKGLLETLQKLSEFRMACAQATSNSEWKSFNNQLQQKFGAWLKNTARRRHLNALAAQSSSTNGTSAHEET